jgi:hypothetical protein
MNARSWLVGRSGGFVANPSGTARVRLLANLLLGGASGACGLAAVGVALYAGAPAQASAAALFAGVGFVAGLLCGGLHAVFEGVPAQPAAALPAQALAGLVRATLATAIAERAPRSGSAADRHSTPTPTPTPTQLASAALAGAAARLMVAPSTTPVTTAVTTAVITPMAAATAAAAAAMARPSAAVAPLAAGAPPQPIDPRRFASSEFGA